MELQQQNKDGDLAPAVSISNEANEETRLQTSGSVDSNEVLLQQLAAAVRARHKTRNLMKGLYSAVCVLYTLFAFYVFSNVSTRGYWLWEIYPVFLASFLPLYLLNAAFYRRLGPLFEQTILPLAERGEERAIGPLLELMDVRASGNTGWKKSRPPFVQAITTLVSGLTPLGFQSLTDMQIHQMTPLIMMPEPGLSNAIRDLFVRCSDARTLRALRRLQTLYKVQRAQKWNPAMKVMTSLIRRFKMPMLNADTIEYVDQCCNAIQSRINAESGDIQLLRASDGNTVGTSEQLLRPTMPGTSERNTDELVRASLGSDGPQKTE